MYQEGQLKPYPRGTEGAEAHREVSSLGSLGAPCARARFLVVRLFPDTDLAGRGELPRFSSRSKGIRHLVEMGDPPCPSAHPGIDASAA